MPGFFSSLLEVGSFDTPSLVLGMAVSGSLALVADDRAGLRVIDISNPSSPTEVGSLATPDFAGGVAVSGSQALVADEFGGLRVIDISDLASPSEVGSLFTTHRARDVAVSGSLALVADGYAGLAVLCVAPRIPIPGDTNGNCAVNAADLRMVAAALGTSDPDLNGDGIVDVRGLAMVGKNFAP